MPVQIAPGEFVQFLYDPDYLAKFEHLKTRPNDIEPIPEVEKCLTSDIVLDGGNVVGCGDRSVVTEKVFRENRGTARNELSGRLRDLLRIDRLIVIPTEPYDEVGHADGFLRFLNVGTVVVYDYSEVAPAYRNRLLAKLRRSGLDWVEVPYRPEEGRRGEIPSAFGNYVNYLRVRSLVVLPTYGLPEDELARVVLADRLPGCDLLTLDCAALSREGGVLNCATWTIVICSHWLADCSQ
jgi:agmatine deiminase